MLVDKLSSRGV